MLNLWKFIKICLNYEEQVDISGQFLTKQFKNWYVKPNIALGNMDKDRHDIVYIFHSWILLDEN